MADTDSSTPERLRALQSRWESDKTSRVFVQLAEEYRRAGRTEEALAVLGEGLTANPNYLAAKVVLGRCHLDLGRTQSAIRELEGVISRDPTQMVAYKLLVEAHLAEGDGEEARKRLRIYSLLNDSDPEIAELRRRIGEAGRHRRDPEDTFVGSLREENAPAAAEPPAHPPVSVRLESAIVVAEPTAAEPPVETPAVFDELVFPDLGLDPARYLAALSTDTIFDLSPGLAPVAAPRLAAPLELEPPPREPIAWQFHEAAPEPAPPAAPVAAPHAFELFDLDDAPPAADLDVTGLLGRVAPVPLPPEPLALAEPELEPEQEPDTAATATLGQLYLRQGHVADAEAMFRRVLLREPANRAAQEGLAEVAAAQTPAAESVEAQPAAGSALRAADLVSGFDPARDGEDATAKKRYLLRGYLARLKGA